MMISNAMVRINLMKGVRHLAGVVAFLLVFSFLLPLRSFAGVAPLAGGAPLLDIIQEDKLDRLKIEKKIEHSDLVVSMLMQTAEASERKGDKEAAIRYAEKAIRFSPKSPLPHFFLSHLQGLTNKEDLARAFGEYITALQLSWDNFWLLSSSVGIIGVAAFFSVLFTALTFLLYAIVCYAPQWIHCADERFWGRIHKNSGWPMIIFFLFLLFFLVPPFWFFIVSLFLFSFFYNPQEKKAVVACLVGLLFLSLMLTPFSIFLTAKQSSLLDQMAKNQQGAFLWSAPFAGEHPSPTQRGSDWKVPFIKASYLVQERDLKEAEISYQEALLQNPNSAMSLNNLGNVYFYRDDLQRALEYYQKAIQISPTYIAAHYNMGQVHNERLAFEEGKKKYLEGKEMDPELVNTYAQLVARYPDYPVVEGRFTKGDLWKEFFKLNMESRVEGAGNLWRIFVGDLSLISFIILSIVVGIGCVFLYRTLSRYVSGGDVCSICLKAICERCQQAFSSYKICGECGKDMKTAVGKKMGGTPKKVYPFFVLPGGGQLALKEPVLALFLLIPFYFLVTLLFAGDHFSTSAHWHLSIEKSPVLFMAVLFLYGISTLDLYLRRRR